MLVLFISPVSASPLYQTLSPPTPRASLPHKLAQESHCKLLTSLLSDQTLMKMCLSWLNKKQERIRQIIKEHLDFLYPGHLCYQKTVEKKFIMSYATESQVTESAFP